jgi:FixJ family two-component response regulator
MGGLSGFEVQWLLSALYPGLPVILLSGWANASARAVAIDNGFVACLPKPCDRKELLSAIAQVTATPDTMN